MYPMIGDSSEVWIPGYTPATLGVCHPPLYLISTPLTIPNPPPPPRPPVSTTRYVIHNRTVKFNQSPRGFGSACILRALFFLLHSPPSSREYVPWPRRLCQVIVVVYVWFHSTKLPNFSHVGSLAVSSWRHDSDRPQHIVRAALIDCDSTVHLPAARTSITHH
ncbi:hypothetical protein J6590_015091 [Homalodisca vitripennis]|nr:hypothetical protein J6590_015091 [Homalodisca vitripennis]